MSLLPLLIILFFPSCCLVGQKPFALMWRGPLLWSWTLSGIWCTPVKSSEFFLPFMLGSRYQSLSSWLLELVSFSVSSICSPVQVVLAEICLPRPTPLGPCILGLPGRSAWGTATSPGAISLLQSRPSEDTWLQTSWGYFFYLTTPGPLGIYIASFIPVHRKILPGIALL